MHSNRRVWRQSIGATLVEVAVIVGCDASLVSLWECGKRVPSGTDVVAWRAALRELERLSRARLENVRE
jgi:transcriptional regulator with XRE-family HTH domain